MGTSHDDGRGPGAGLVDIDAFRPPRPRRRAETGRILTWVDRIMSPNFRRLGGHGDDDDDDDDWNGSPTPEERPLRPALDRAWREGEPEGDVCQDRTLRRRLLVATCGTHSRSPSPPNVEVITMAPKVHCFGCRAPRTSLCEFEMLRVVLGMGARVILTGVCSTIANEEGICLVWSFL
jgi:hypothetical protein